MHPKFQHPNHSSLMVITVLSDRLCGNTARCHPKSVTVPFPNCLGWVLGRPAHVPVWDVMSRRRRTVSDACRDARVRPSSDHGRSREPWERVRYDQDQEEHRIACLFVGQSTHALLYHSLFYPYSPVWRRRPLGVSEEEPLLEDLEWYIFFLFRRSVFISIQFIGKASTTW